MTAVSSKEKINYDNLFLEMYTDDRKIMQKFLNIQGYKNKVCFVPFEVCEQNVYSLKMYPDHLNFWQTVNSNAGNRSNSIAYNQLSLLLGDSASRQTLVM